MIKLIRRFLDNEIIRYAITGGLVTLTNAVGYFLLREIGIIYTVSNIVSLILSKVVGYLLNKFWVYKSINDSLMQTFLELLRFILARGFTGLVDFFGLILMVELFGWNDRISKIIIMLLVIVLNYVLGKKAVFIKKEKNESEPG
ncbi:MAG: GtrA family protein [Lachnospiraceae bacterium]|nr:GtrA family protein [Lachnospiraceae bacterium]